MWTAIEQIVEAPTRHASEKYEGEASRKQRSA